MTPPSAAAGPTIGAGEGSILQPRLATSGIAYIREPVQTDVHTVEWKHRPAYVAVTVDVPELLARLGRKALRSKGKRATAFYGAVVVYARPAHTINEHQETKA
jgi:hypothetical protein